jgi:hypothetical protein
VSENVNHRFDQGVQEMEDASEKVKQLLHRLESCHAKLHNWPDLQMADSLDLLGHGHKPASQPLSLDACDYPSIAEFYDAIAEWNHASGEDGGSTSVEAAVTPAAGRLTGN